ncbi:MAG TPA: hypothetical protein VNJ08_13290 [Bacteriovoracaceae bacterium]|nr:hypothetical protein [Bacteriovoracaceae bacterium]
MNIKCGVLPAGAFLKTGHTYILILISLVSCASKKLIYNPNELKPLSEMSKVTSIKINGFSIAVEPFVDLREIRDSAGRGYTGMFNTETPAYLEGGIEAYVQNRLLQGFQKRGLRVDQTSEYLLRGKIVEFWIDEQTTGMSPEQSVCYVKFDMALFKKGNAVPEWYGITWVKAASKATFLDTTNENGHTMDSCMNIVLEKFIREKNFQQITGIKLNE